MRTLVSRSQRILVPSGAAWHPLARTRQGEVRVAGRPICASVIYQYTLRSDTDLSVSGFAGSSKACRPPSHPHVGPREIMVGVVVTSCQPNQADFM